MGLLHSGRGFVPLRADLAPRVRERPPSIATIDHYEERPIRSSAGYQPTTLLAWSRSISSVS
jgi:hypothetical protein